MKTCVNGCGTKTNKKHCNQPEANCPWYVCVVCKIIFDPEHLNREMPWKEYTK